MTENRPKSPAMADYKTQFPGFDDLTPILDQLPVKFMDFSWRHDNRPNFQFAVDDGVVQETFPRLVLWIDHADTQKRASGRQRFILELVLCEEEFFTRNAEVLVSSDDLQPIIAAIKRVIGDGITMSLYKEFNADGRLYLYMHHEGMAIENPFMSDCSRFNVSPGFYGLNETTGAIFLNGMPMEQLRDVISWAIGNTDVFDALPSDEQRRVFATEYLVSALNDDA